MNIANALRALLDPENGRNPEVGLGALWDNARAALAAHDAAAQAGGWRSGRYTPDGTIDRIWDDQGQLMADGADPVIAARIVACVNACQGIADPARLVPALRTLTDECDYLRSMCRDALS